MKLIARHVKNDLAKKLAYSLSDPNNKCSIAEEFSYLEIHQCLDKVKRYMDWIKELNVHSVMIISSPSIDVLCLCYALVLCNKTYIPVHSSTSVELLENYVQTYKIDLLWIHPIEAEKFDYQFKQKLHADRDKTFFYYLPKIQHTFCITPGVVLFTSGTTGLPKAVHFQFNTISRYLSWCINEFNLNDKDNVLFTTELAFVASLRPLFIPIMVGASITIIDNHSKNKLQLITQAILKKEITVLNVTPTFFKILMRHIEKTQNIDCLLSIRLILLSGEPIDIEIINYWFFEISSNTIFYNLYGSTECLVPFYKKIQSPIKESEKLHLGQLRQGCDYELLPNVTKNNELCISGDLSTAYLNEKLTQENYLIINNHRYIKTNDFVKIKRINNKKELFFCSRAQRLIKRYGQLINLDQIENILKKWIKELDFIIFADEKNENEIYLIIHKSPYDVDLLEKIHLCLKKYLPSYMHPNQFIFTQDIFMTSSGKIDYSLMKKKFIYNPPKKISDYFNKFFDDKPINLNTKIVDLGLESIDYIEMIDKLIKITGKWLDVSKITDQTRIADIESCLTELNQEKSKTQPIVGMNRIQKVIYSNELNHNTSQSSSHVVSLCLHDLIDIKRLEKAISETIDNHFILSSKLEWINDDYFFVNIDTQSSFKWHTPIFFGRNDLIKLETSVHADRLVRFYIQKKRNRYFFIMAYHHIALDGWSAMLVREEIFRRYEGTHKIPCLNKSKEINYLNKANEFWLHNNRSFKELSAHLFNINPYEYNHLESLFHGDTESKNICFSLKKDHVEQFMRVNQLSEFPHSVIFALVLHKMISQLAGVNKLFFYVSFANRNIPLPNIKNLITNLAFSLPVFFNNTNLITKEFADQIKETLSIYFKNISYTGVKEIWENELIPRDYLSATCQKYKIFYTYINKITQDEYIQDKYIDWSKSTNDLSLLRSKNLSRKSKVIIFRIYNMNSHFVVMLDSNIKKNMHDCLIKSFSEIMDITL